MYKGTKRLDQSSVNKSIINTTILSQTTNQTIEREIDSYTRILEQDKRKFFRMQENKNQILKQYSHKVKELDLLKSRSFKTETLKKKADLKIIQKELDHMVSSYNQVLANSKKLKNDIDELRKEKKNQKEAFKTIVDRTNEVQCLIDDQKEQIIKKKDTISVAKSGIIGIKMKNDLEMKTFRKDVNQIKGAIVEKKEKGSLKKKSEVEVKSENIDTQPLVKLRLKNLISKNKEKIKIMDSYKKNMNAIWKSFEEIKEESGISDLNQITSTFLKQEEQSLSLYQYINKLTKEIQDLQDVNKQKNSQILFQKEINESYQAKLGQTPEKINQKEIEDQMVCQSSLKIDQLKSFLVGASPLVNNLKTTFGEKTDEEELNHINIEQSLAEIENWIDQLYDEQQATCYYKEEATKYSKTPPSLPEELKDQKEDRIMEAEKLRDFASDYWERRKAKMEIK